MAWAKVPISRALSMHAGARPSASGRQGHDPQPRGRFAFELALAAHNPQLGVQAGGGGPLGDAYGVEHRAAAAQIIDQHRQIEPEADWGTAGNPRRRRGRAGSCAARPQPAGRDRIDADHPLVRQAQAPARDQHREPRDITVR